MPSDAYFEADYTEQELELAVRICPLLMFLSQFDDHDEGNIIDEC